MDGLGEHRPRQTRGAGQQWTRPLPMSSEVNKREDGMR